MPREPLNGLFGEIDIQNKNCFDKWNHDIRGHNPLKTHMKEFMCNTARSQKSESL